MASHNRFIVVSLIGFSVLIGTLVALVAFKNAVNSPSLPSETSNKKTRQDWNQYQPLMPGTGFKVHMFDVGQGDSQLIGVLCCCFRFF